MDKCSYTWELWDEEEEEVIIIRCPHETWEGSEEFCIFHDPSPGKDRNLFTQKLEQQMASETEKHFFIRYFFPKNWNFFQNYKFKNEVDFREATFQDADFREATFQDVDFLNATFQGDADFSFATFQGYTSFSGATFQKDADFWKATFQGYTSFRDAIFQKDAHFWGATFQRDANFSGATFQRDANFSGATFQDADFSFATFQDLTMNGTIFKVNLEFKPREIQKIDLRNSKFFFMGTITAELSRTRFHDSSLKNVSFIDCVWPKKYILYEEEHVKDEEINLSYKELETIYRNLKQSMQNNGDYSLAGEFYYREMECKKESMRKKRFSFDWLKSYIYSFFKYLCGYGERPLNVIGMAAIIVFLFAFSFQYWGIVMGEYTTEEQIIDYDLHLAFPTWNGVKDYLQCVYYSFVTFTTLGYGDVHPIGYSKAAACAESFIGAFSIALFVLVFGRKMLR